MYRQHVRVSCNCLVALRLGRATAPPWPDGKGDARWSVAKWPSGSGQGPLSDDTTGQRRLCALGFSVALDFLTSNFESDRFSIPRFFICVVGTFRFNARSLSHCFAGGGGKPIDAWSIM